MMFLLPITDSPIQIDFFLFKNFHFRGFPGSPVVKTLPSKSGGVGLIPGQRAKLQHASQPKN